MSDPFALTLFDKPCPYPSLLMFAVAHGIRPTSTRKPIDLNALAATRRATEAALERARQQRAVTEAWYAQKAQVAA